MIHRFCEVQNVDHDRGNADDPFVDGADQPSRPAPLGASGDEVFVDGSLAPFFGCHQFGDRIHGADDAFDHRVACGPSGDRRFQEFHPGIGDQIVFRATFAIIVKDQRLVGNHVDFGHNRLCRFGDLHNPLRRPFRGLAAVSSAADPHKADIGLNFVRNGDRDPVLPLGAVDVVVRPPILRNHIKHERLHAIRLIVFDDFPARNCHRVFRRNHPAPFVRGVLRRPNRSPLPARSNAQATGTEQHGRLKKPRSRRLTCSCWRFPSE